MTTYYVTTSGSDSNNGLTEGTAFATPGYAAGQATTSGDIIYIKAGTYTLSTTTSNVSGGPVNLSRGLKVEGYQTTTGDQAARPVINAGSQAVTNVINYSSPSNNTLGTICKSIEVNGNSVATNGINAGANWNGTISNCIIRNCTYGFVGGQSGNADTSYAINCTDGFRGRRFYLCYAKQCTNGFNSTGNGFVFDSCIADSCSYAFYMFQTPGSVTNSIAYASTNDGFRSQYDLVTFTKCIASENGGYGWYMGNSGADESTIDCADYNNALGRTIGVNSNLDIRPINLTADPFTSASTGDFTLNNDTGGGAELRQIQLSGLAGVNGVFDVGAIDAVVTAGGGGAVLHPLRSN